MSMEQKAVRKSNDFIKSILPGWSPYEFSCKDGCINQHIEYMLNRTQSMFKWTGLPDSIPQRVLELFLQINGNVCFYEYNGTLYVFVGGLGGEPNVYYMPTKYTISNPALKFSKTLEIDTDCVVMPNDSMYSGLIPLFSRYATAMTETELSIDMAIVNSRIVDLISAPDDRTKESAIKFIEDIRCGKLGVIAENSFLNGIKAQPYGNTGNSNTLTNLIEMMQYQKASWFNELGLNANYNMKRESLNSAESQLNNDALLPLVDNMLEMRRVGAEKVNAMFGTSISVDFASSWEDNIEEIEAEQENISGQPETESDDNGGKDDVETEKTY